MKRQQAFSIAKHTARLSFIVPGFFLLLLSGCKSPERHHISTAFYYWKTRFSTSPYERQLLQETGTQVLYLRMFDVHWDENEQQAVPIGMLRSEAVTDTSLQYVPVLYITQACLTRLQDTALPELSRNISRLLTQLCYQYKLSPQEVQVDCDWTQSTAALYFRLLEQLRQQSFFKNKLLSCTIRLHQVKYVTSSGIPPADKGLLMVYNMGNLTRYGSHNSVLDPDAAQQYLHTLQAYPLPLDVALPLYHWAVLFEQKQFKGILYNLSKEQLDPVLLARREGNLYRITADGEAGGYTLKKGQEIRFEAPPPEALEQIASFIGPRLRDSSFRLAFFHLDSAALQPYTAAALLKIRAAF